MKDVTANKRGEYKIKTLNLVKLNAFLKKVEKTNTKNESNN